jgi:predicted N-acetyltransferase YhbS
MDDLTFTIRTEQPHDRIAREALLDRALGPARFLKSSQRLRAGCRPAPGLSLSAVNRAGDLVGTVRLWNVSAGGRPALLLGPLAVDGTCRSAGIGSALMRESLERADHAGHGAVLLVGDPGYYGRFGFSAEPTSWLVMPGPTERRRFLARELEAGYLRRAWGRVIAAGRPLHEAETLPERIAA